MGVGGKRPSALAEAAEVGWRQTKGCRALGLVGPSSSFTDAPRGLRMPRAGQALDCDRRGRNLGTLYRGPSFADYNAQPTVHERSGGSMAAFKPCVLQAKLAVINPSLCTARSRFLVSKSQSTKSGGESRLGSAQQRAILSQRSLRAQRLRGELL